MSKLLEKLENLPPRTRQYITLGAMATILMGVVFGSMSLMDSAPTVPQAASSTQINPTNIAPPGGAVDPREVWMSQSAQQMKQMDDVVRGLKEQMAQMQAKASATPATQQLLPPLPPQPLMPSVSTQAPTLTGASGASSASGASGASGVPEITQPPREKGISSFEVSASMPAAKPAEQDTSLGYVPAGSFARVALLGGLDAPTGGQAQNNPHPILMRLQDNAFLPNRYRFEIRECFLIASGFGDISSERAYARLENLSCVRRDGQAVDMTVKGYVVGEDGKAGMRGRLISKQGQVLANALLAGIGSGIGQAFQNSSSTQSISPLGTTSTVNQGQELRNGVSAGVGKTLDRLSKYYIDLAEKLFPVIEIDAGRTVEVVFTKGFTFGKGLGGSGEGQYSEIWKRGKRVMNENLDQPVGQDNATNRDDIQ